MANSDIQRIIDKIRRLELPERELISLLDDPRGLVRANVLMALPNKSLENPQSVVDAIVAAATDPAKSAVMLLGNTSQRKLAIATLAWLEGTSAHESYNRIVANLSDRDKEDIAAFVRQGPIS